MFVAATVFGDTVSTQKLAWREMADLPRPVAGYMAGIVNGLLFIIGGSYWEDKQKHRTDLVQVLDPATNIWSRSTALPASRSDGASATLGADIYCFGGVVDEEARSDVLLFHDSKWTTVPDATFPEPRLYSGAIVSGGYIYLLGGMSKLGDYQTVANTFWRWRPGMKGWEVLPPVPGPGLINHAMAEIDGSIFVFGGGTAGPQNVKNLPDAYKYDLATRKWSRLPDLTVANRSWSAVAMGHRALLLAGYANDFASAVYIYEVKQGLQSVGELPHGLADIKFFRVKDRIVGTGGEAAIGVRGKWTLESKIPKKWLDHITE